MSRRISYMMTAGGTGQPQLHYPQLTFQPKAFFALGSPVGMFVTVRGLDTLGEQFELPTCPAFFNIFHPYDPVAYRIESLINPELSSLKPVLIPHHKGRKRMHLGGYLKKITENFFISIFFSRIERNDVACGDRFKTTYKRISQKHIKFILPIH